MTHTVCELYLNKRVIKKQQTVDPILFACRITLLVKKHDINIRAFERTCMYLTLSFS